MPLLAVVELPRAYAAYAQSAAAKELWAPNTAQSINFYLYDWSPAKTEVVTAFVLEKLKVIAGKLNLFVVQNKVNLLSQIYS